jgi:hypothetical protein
MEIMEVKTIAELIAALGFPIVVCGILGWFIWKIYKKSEDREDALRSQIVDSQKVNAEAIHTIALYAERLGIIEEDLKEVKHDVNILIHKQ